MIPKKIHYCWFGPKPFPKVVKKCIASWEHQLDEYEFCFWNEQNSPMDIPFVKDAYEAKKYAFVADYIRFWALHTYGGIYLDTDMFVLKPLDELLHNDCFFAWETADKNIISCGIVGCNINNPFILKILEIYNSLLFNADQLSRFIVPRLITPIYEQYENKDNITIFDYDYFYPFPYKEKENVGNFLKYTTENTYAVHLWNISWGTWSDKLRDRIFYYIHKLRNK